MARIIVATIIRVNRICQQDATISRLLNKELLLQNVSHAKSLIKLACSPITGYFGPYQLPTLCTTISTRYYVYLVCLAYDNRLDHFFLSNSLPLKKKRNNIIVRIPSKISWASMQISIIETEFKDPSNDTQIARMKFEQAAINFLLHRWRANYPYDSNTYPKQIFRHLRSFHRDMRNSSSILARGYKLCGNGTAPLHCYEKPGISRANNSLALVEVHGYCA